MAGFIQAAFALPVKFFRGWRWEHMWMAQAVTSNLLFPLLWAWSLSSGFWRLAADVPRSHWLACYGLGVLWGMGGVAYGLTLTRLGISFAYSFVFGTTTLAGALLPLLLSLVEAPRRPLIFAAGMAMCLVAIVAIGILRRGGGRQDAMPMPIGSPPYRWALLIGLFAGVFSASYGLAFSYGFREVDAFLRAGVPPVSAPLIIALPVYLGSATVAIPLGLFCAARSRTLPFFLERHAAWNWMLAFFMGICGTAGVILYGFGSSAAGHPAPNVSFGIYMTFFVLAGNAMGYLSGELRGRSAAAGAGFALSLAGLIGAAWLLNLR